MIKSIYYYFYTKITGKNHPSVPSHIVVDQLNERRPLPVGMTDFDAFTDRIIAGAMITATPESQKFAIAEMIMHLGPQESHKEDAFFIHGLRKSAANQIAHAKMTEIRDAAKSRLEREKAEEKIKESDSNVLAIRGNE